MGNITTAITSTTISQIFSYPFEIAHTRLIGDMTRHGHKKIYSSVTELFTKMMEESNFININN